MKGRKPGAGCEKGSCPAMKVHPLFSVILAGLMTGVVLSQEMEEQTSARQKAAPRSVDFSRIFETESTREEFDRWKRERQVRLEERLQNADALEQAVDPAVYRVGPGDIFDFHVWGVMEQSVLIAVSPEGKLTVPSVGGIDVDGKVLSDVQQEVIGRAKKIYQNSEISLTLESLRNFRVHVVGEVIYPGTYIGRAVDRISGLILEAGGVTDRAWKRAIELRHTAGGEVDTFDLAAFEQTGDLSHDFYVQGGDVIHVPATVMEKPRVSVEGEMNFSGIYQIEPGESLIPFLERIRVLKKETDLTKVQVCRKTVTDKGKTREECTFPIQDKSTTGFSFTLQEGDRIVMPPSLVYVKGAVLNPGAYPYAFNLTAKDYAGMAGGDFRSGSIKSIQVYHALTGKSENGPGVLVEPGDVVHLHPNWGTRLDTIIRTLPTLTSLILAAKAAGLFDK